MKTLYEIDNNLLQLLECGFNEDCIDKETGEIFEDKLSELLNEYQAERESKIEAVALYIRQLDDEVEASKRYEKDLAERRAKNEKRADSLKKYLTRSLDIFGQNSYKSVKVAVTLRKSTAVIVDENTLDAKWWRVTEKRTPDKAGIATALKCGQDIQGAALVERKNISIK